MKPFIAVLFLMPALAMAAGPAADPAGPSDEPPAFGLSNNVVGDRPDNDDDTAVDTRRMLDQQARSGGAADSEISAPVYVQTQQRLSKSFDEPIPDFKNDQTRDDGN